jgi:hypothetical protein
MGPHISSGVACRAVGHAAIDYAAVPSPFSMDEATFRDLGHQLVDTLAAYLDQLPREPVYRPLPAEVRSELELMNISADPQAPEDVIEGFYRLVLPYGRGQNHPRFAAFVDPAASKLSMLAAFAAAVTNTSGAGGNYAAIYVEQTVIRWLTELIGFPCDSTDGVLLGGGSDANRHCLEVAVLGCPGQRLGRQGRRPARAPAAHHVHVGGGPFLPRQGRFHARPRHPEEDSRGRGFPHGRG